MNWKNEINKIYELASLHSWCSQVNNMITDFNNVYKNSNSIIDYLVSNLKEKNLPNEYYIISIVLLNYQEYPKEDIIELAIRSLYSKLNKNDILFFKEHLFSGEFPLSSDLSEDITNRLFLSPKVAIQKAMNIDSVISKNNPIVTVMYMNFILSRMDMNEENRAMVAFLLLRLDIDLPKSLKERVYTYLLKYKDIIQELLHEETGESIQIEDISGIEKIIAKVEIVEENKSSTFIREADVINTSKNSGKNTIITNDNSVKDITKEQNDIEYSGKSNLQDTNSLSESKSEIKPFSTKVQLQKKNISFKTGNTVKTKKRKIIKPDNNKINKKKAESISDSSKNPLKKLLSNNINSNAVQKSREVKQVKEDKHVKKEKQDNNILEKYKPVVGDVNPGKKSWKIFLKENQQILKNILAGMEKTGTGRFLKKNKQKKSINVNKSNSEKNFYKNRSTIYLLVLIIVIPLLIIPIFRNTGRSDEKPFLRASVNENDLPVDNSSINKPESPEDASGQKAIDNEGLGNNNSVQLPANKITSIPDNFPVNIQIKDKTVFWEVLEGESITGLFYAFQDNKQSFKNTKLEKLANLSWEEFFKIFKDNNTERLSYHIIFPGEEFYLPFE